MFKKYRLRDFDFRLVILVLLASGISVMAVGSANESYVKTQIIGIVGGFVAMLIIALFDYAWVLKFYWVMYVGILGLLVLTAYSPLGETSGGAQRWIDLKVFNKEKDKFLVEIGRYEIFVCSSVSKVELQGKTFINGIHFEKDGEKKSNYFQKYSNIKDYLLFLFGLQTYLTKTF